jgi:hypothetical protein
MCPMLPLGESLGTCSADLETTAWPYKYICFAPRSDDTLPACTLHDSCTFPPIPYLFSGQSLLWLHFLTLAAVFTVHRCTV